MVHDDDYCFRVIRYNVRKYRIKANMTQQELADSAGVTMNRTGLNELKNTYNYLYKKDIYAYQLTIIDELECQLQCNRLLAKLKMSFFYFKIWYFIIKKVKLMNYERISNFKDTKFKRTVGVPRILFEILVEITRNYLLKMHKKGGRKPKLNAENILLMFFYYYRDYPTFLSLANKFNLDESNAWRWIRKIEKLLYDCLSIQHSNIEFSQLINISCFDAKEKTIRIVDVTECNIQRSKKVDIQKEYYSEKKKKHTLKIQIIIEEGTNKILSIAFEKGSVHDYKVFKNTTKDMNKEISFLADSGYQGIDKLFKHSTTPKKKSKNNPLTDEDKEFNHLISTNRISVEHTNC